MKNRIWILPLCACLLIGCDLSLLSADSRTEAAETPAAPQAKPPQTPPKKTVQPQTSPVPDTAAAAGAKAGSLSPAGDPGVYWMENPSSGAKLYVRVTSQPEGGNGSLPVVILVPGGIGAQNLTDRPDADTLALAKAGYLVVSFDADGRGQSGGEEDYNGFMHQDGLAALVLAVGQLPQADPAQIGIISRSYGITMAAGALGRYPDLPVRFLIDWEGPADRNYTTTGCRPPRPDGIQWQPCADEAFWVEREAVAFIGKARMAYQRIQSEKDHVQLDNRHAVDMVNAAMEGGVPWVRLNDYPADQTYDPASPPAMFPDEMDRTLPEKFVEYAQALFALPGS